MPLSHRPRRKGASRSGIEPNWGVFGLIVMEHLGEVAHVHGLAADIADLEVSGFVSRLRAYAPADDSTSWVRWFHFAHSVALGGRARPELR